ncbi:major capsid protein [Paenibacillus azoreducens]|uniref:major capsid protein n=1 Tax=Paenibacillus azoreducens TaxID=116718 RepID=UPI0039F604F9
MKLRQSTILNTLRGGRPQNAAPQGPNVNIYEPQTMTAPFSKRMPVTTFIRDTFFPGLQTFPTKHVLMDFQKNKQRVAPFVAEGSKPVNIRRDGFQTKVYTPPYISLSAPYDVDLLQARLPGEAVFNSGMTPEERALLLMQNDYNELDDMITRKEEVMTSELLQSGTITLTGYIDDTATKVRTDTVDFGFDNVLNLTGGSQWSQSTSKKYDDLYEAVSLVRKAGYNPERVILGEQAARNLLADEAFMDKYMDKRYAQFGAINPQLNLTNGNGYAYIGRLTELGIDLYQYLAWYWDDIDNKLKPYINPNKVIVGTPNLGEMLYGAITQIPEESINFVTIEAPRVSKVTVDRNADTKSLIVKSRPIPKPYDVDSWAVINTEQ